MRFHLEGREFPARILDFCIATATLKVLVDGPTESHELTLGGRHVLEEMAVQAVGAARFEEHIESQAVLHFETESEWLGPGRLLAYDFGACCVSITLQAEHAPRQYSFEQINDFGIATYHPKPRSVDDLLMATYAEARGARRGLESLVVNSYAHIAPEEIDDFAQITAVSSRDVEGHLPLLMGEQDVKTAICQILGFPFIPHDWGGELCDIACDIRFRRRTVPAAFVLKGREFATRPLRIANLGKNGDQVVRMFSLPATVFVVQSNGPIDQAVHSHVRAEVARKIMSNTPVHYLMLDGVATARLLRAYSKL
jgi:hypothetical protein